MSAVVRAYAALVSLAALSLGAAYVPLGRLGVPVALAIATAKAAIVAIVFMELRRERASARVAVVAAVGLVVALAGLTAADVATRDPSPALLQR